VEIRPKTVRKSVPVAQMGLDGLVCCYCRVECALVRLGVGIWLGDIHGMGYIEEAVLVFLYTVVTGSLRGNVTRVYEEYNKNDSNCVLRVREWASRP
jgi:hypothetical protein